MIDFGTVRPGTTLYIPFATYDSNDPAASVTLTGLATTDIEVYKNGSVTQRASDAGYALLDTDGIDFDAVTGIHGFSIDLADNTDAGFYSAGAQYWVVVASVTVDAGTVNFIAATFQIGLPDAVLNTTIATLASQTSFTLTAGPAEDGALKGCVVYIHDVASAVQAGYAIVSDYTGASKTVTLVAGTTFTAAATDNISVFPPALQPTVWGRTLDVSAGGEAGVDWANVGTPGSTVALSATTVNLVATTGMGNQTANITGNLSGSVGSVTGAVGSVTGAVGSVTGAVGSVGAGGIAAASFAAGAIDAAALAADAGAELADAFLNRDMATGTDSGSTTVRTVRQALRFLRNKWSISGTTLTVTKEDDTTASWTATMTTDAAADPITASDPAGP